jgi:hypothetical protein
MNLIGGVRERFCGSYVPGILNAISALCIFGCAIVPTGSTWRCPLIAGFYLPRATSPATGLLNCKPIKVGSDLPLSEASQILKSPDDILPVVEFLLGQTIIVRDRTHARRILKSSGAQRVVTLKGEVFRADGPIQAGRENRSGSISRPRQRREIKDSLASLQSSLAR